MLDLTVPAQLSLALLPELVLMGGAMLVLLWAGWRRESDAHQRSVGWASLIVVIATLAISIWHYSQYREMGNGPIQIDGFRYTMDVVILLGTAFTIALGMDDNSREVIVSAESHVLVLLAASGMMLLAAATDLMIVFLGIEMMSISVYALAGINRRNPRSAEGALKYFLLGAFATAFLLYGIAMVYGATGTTRIDGIAYAIGYMNAGTSPLLVVGLAMLVIGFGFKVAAAPFHMWAPDVYDGAPSSITAFMAATVKAAAFATFLRVWLQAFPQMADSWYKAIFWVAIVTMVAGNAIGLVQKNLKRLLAYSSIAHAGYLLVLVSVRTLESSTALVFYLLAYSLATFGAFAAVISLSEPGKGTVMVEDLAGLWKRRPWTALGLGVMMLSLLGFPFFGGAGFFAKWYLLQTALHASVKQTTLAVMIVLTSVLSAGYYLRVVMVMFMRPTTESTPTPPPAGAMARGVLFATVAATLLIGVAPELVVRWTEQGRIVIPSMRSTAAAPTMPPARPGLAR